MNNMHRLRIALAWSLLALLTLTARVEAQTRLELDQSPADAWLTDALVAQRRLDGFGRFAAAPSALLLGGGALLLPAGVDLGPTAAAAYVASGLFMLSAAVGAWAHSDAYASQRWFALSASLGFMALGGGLVLSCVERDDGCSEKSLTRSLQMGIGIAEAGLFASTLVTALLVPAPSPSELQLSVRDLSLAERETRVLDFLERRDRARRMYNYLTAPWLAAMGGVLLANAHDAATPGGQVVMYVTGGALLGLTIGALLYEQLRKSDAQRLREGKLP